MSLTHPTIGVVEILAFLTAPSFLNKVLFQPSPILSTTHTYSTQTCVHVVQLLSASHAIARHDVATRHKEEQSSKKDN